MSISIKKNHKPVRIVIDNKGSLSKHGYSSRNTAKERHESLAKAIRSIVRDKNLSLHQSAVKVSRRLNALEVLNKNKKTMSDTFRRDSNWVRKNYYDKEKLKLKSKRRKSCTKKNTKRKKSKPKRRTKKLRSIKKK